MRVEGARAVGTSREKRNRTGPLLFDGSALPPTVGILSTKISIDFYTERTTVVLQQTKKTVTSVALRREEDERGGPF